MKKTYTLYVAAQKVFGSDVHSYRYFESIKERNEFVRNADYSDAAGTVKLNETQYEQFKQFGRWDRYAE